MSFKLLINHLCPHIRHLFGIAYQLKAFFLIWKGGVTMLTALSSESLQPRGDAMHHFESVM